jgi:hypothetical protein
MIDFAAKILYDLTVAVFAAKKERICDSGPE